MSLRNRDVPHAKDQWPIRLDRVRARPEGKKKRYVAHFERDGQHCKVALKTTNKEAALKAALQLEAKLSTGTYSAPAPKKRIDESISLYLTSKQSDNVSPKTLVKYRKELETFEAYLQDQGIIYLHALTEQVLEKYRGYRQNTHLRKDTPASIHEKTLYTGLMIIKGFAKWCARRGRLLPHDPLQWFSVAKPALVKHPAPTLAMVNAILEKATMPRQAQYAFLSFTGARSGEMALMQRRDVDVEHKWLMIPTLKQKRTRIIVRRKVPLHPRLQGYLTTYMAQFPAAADAPLFAAAPSGKYPAGNHPLNTKHLCEAFERLARALNLPVGRKHYGLVIHSLRHFMETFCVNAGIPQRVVDAWMGHVGDRSMGNVYYDLHDADSQNFMGRVPF